MRPRRPPRIEETEAEGNLSTFEVNPLADGYGVTLGNALRRVLLNSLEGAAVTSIQIANVFHEFSTLPNVKEDVTQIVLNVKKLRLRSFARHPITLKLVKHGAGPVTAGDIAESADVEIVNPELVLLTLDSDAGSIEMDLTVETGVGYRPAEHTEDMPIGIIPVDAIFSPVRRVNFVVSDTRVGQMTNFDRLTLEIETDGTSTPKAALSQAADILVREFSRFTEIGRRPLAGEEEAPAPMAANLLDAPIEELDLPMRAYNSLKRNNITKIGQVLALVGRRVPAHAQLRQQEPRRAEGAPGAPRLHQSRRPPPATPTSPTCRPRPSWTRPPPPSWTARPRTVPHRVSRTQAGPLQQTIGSTCWATWRWRCCATSASRPPRPRPRRSAACVDGMITTAKRGDLHARRSLASQMPHEPLIIDKLMGELATKYADRSSGYTRIVKIGERLGDAAPIVQIELV